MDLNFCDRLSLGLRNLRPVVAHVVQRPGVFNNQNWNPLGFVVYYKHCNAKDKRAGIYNKKDDVKKFLVAGFFFIIRDI